LAAFHQTPDFFGQCIGFGKQRILLLLGMLAFLVKRQYALQRLLNIFKSSLF
jgi:hypothetical protein